MLKKAVRQGRSEVHGAKNNEVRDATGKERHVCARARDGERPVSFRTPLADFFSILLQHAPRTTVVLDHPVRFDRTPRAGRVLGQPAELLCLPRF